MEIPFPVTEDQLLAGRVRLLQPEEGYRAAIDPVFLAASVVARAGERVLDLGCGAGAASLCLLARLPHVTVSGLELQPEMADLARRNADLNQMADRLQVVIGSAATLPVALSGFDHVMTNPPFFTAQSGTHPGLETKALSHVEGELNLTQWIRAGLALLRPKGRLTLIHRAERLGDILVALSGRGVGGIVVTPLWPKVGRHAGRVIVSARKGARAPLELRPGLVLHGEDGSYSEAAQAILRGAEALTP
ncbi:MAG: methyltransferase [Magnetospirillum sp.]|nr:methyltransferase [Magnetospirillum sp.]